MLAEERLPPQPEIERQTVCRAPGILGEQADVPLLWVGASGPAEFHGGHTTQQKIGESETGHLSVEIPLAAAPRARLNVRAPFRDRRAEPELMPAAHECEIVADLVGIGIGEAVAGARVARDEPA